MLLSPFESWAIGTQKQVAKQEIEVSGSHPTHWIFSPSIHWLLVVCTLTASFK